MRDTIEMAREAGFPFNKYGLLQGDGDGEIDADKMFKAFAKLVAAHERNKLAAWMIQFGFATGHGDTMEELVDALGTEIVDRIDGEVEAEREACAKVCESEAANPSCLWEEPGCWSHAAENCAGSIRARGETK
jgi:hypothetical protein